jgi:hypothetical protein
MWWCIRCLDGVLDITSGAVVKSVLQKYHVTHKTHSVKPARNKAPKRQACWRGKRVRHG